MREFLGTLLPQFIYIVPKENEKNMKRKADIEAHRRALLTKFSSEITPEVNNEENTSSALTLVVKRIVLRVWFLRSEISLPSH